MHDDDEEEEEEEGCGGKRKIRTCSVCDLAG